MLGLIVKKNKLRFQALICLLLGSAEFVSAQDFYNPANNQLSISNVIVGNVNYSNVVITVGNVLSIGGSTSLSSSLTSVPYPKINVSYGDWAVYNQLVTPSSGNQTSANLIKYYGLVNSDKSLTVTETGSSASTMTYYSYDNNGGIVSYTYGGVSCNYAPPFQASPPYNTQTVVSNQYTSTRTCSTGSNATENLNRTFTLLGSESISIPNLGVFSAFKYVYSGSTLLNGITSTINSTGWVDTISGLLLKSITSVTSPSSTSSTTTQLTSYSNGGKQFGSPVQRFQGYWTFRLSNIFTGSTPADIQGAICSNIFIDFNGNISGTCPSSAGGNAQMNGTVDLNGNIQIQSSSGVNLVGLLNTTSSGSGKYSNPQSGQTWQAVHN